MWQKQLLTGRQTIHLHAFLFVQAAKIGLAAGQFKKEHLSVHLLYKIPNNASLPFDAYAAYLETSPGYATVAVV